MSRTEEAKIAVIETRVEQLEQRVSDLEEEIQLNNKANERRFAEIEAGLKDVNQTMVSLDTQINKDGINGMLARILKRQDDHEQRLRNLEKTLWKAIGLLGAFLGFLQFLIQFLFKFLIH